MKSKTYRFTAIPLFFCVFFSLLSISHAAEKTLKWYPLEPAPDGYRIFYRGENEQYDYDMPLWEGTDTEYTVTDLADNTSHYFVIRAFACGNETPDSDETYFNQTNTPPVLDIPEVQSDEDSNMIEFTVTASDPENNPIILSSSTLPNGASFNTSTGKFTWPLDSVPGGTYNVTFTGTDNGTPALTDSKEITLVVAVKGPTDSDGDGVADDADAFPNDKTEWKDTDNDGTGNNADTDDDNDGMPDTWEIQYGFNTLANDANNDPDNDGYTNLQEHQFGLNPGEVDSNIVPHKPALKYPLAEKEISLTETLLCENYYDSDNDPHAKSRWQISEDADFKTFVLDLTSTTQLTSLNIPYTLLSPDKTYHWRAQFIDNQNGRSEWSAPNWFTTIERSDSDDTDENGVPDSQEVGNLIDLDRNGTSDTLQSDILSVNTIGGDSYIGIKSNSASVDVASLMSLQYDNDGDSAAEEIAMPSGYIAFKLILNDDATEATITIYFDEPAPLGAKWYKTTPYGEPIVYDNAVFSSDRMSIAVTIEDGSEWDDDGVVNGVIVDPSGLGISPEDSDDSTLSSSSGSRISGNIHGTDVNANASCFITTLDFTPTERSNRMSLLSRILVLLTPMAAVFSKYFKPHK